MNTLVHLFAERQGLADRGVFFVENGEPDRFCSYRQIYREARSLLSNLGALGICKGDYLILQTRSNRELLLMFWACILGGIVPVPLTYAQNAEMTLKLRNVAQVLGKCHIAGDAVVKEKLLQQGAGACLASFHILDFRSDSEENPSVLHGDKSDETVCGDDLAFVQFSSGSTGNPKGVMLTHRNLLCNIRAMEQALEMTSEDTGISWLPLTHDMGMIGAHLNCLYCGINLILIDSKKFLFHPSLLLEKVTEYKATLTVTPNFALDYMVHYYGKKKEKAPIHWDLSSLRLILCGAEPISVRSVQCFEKTFAEQQLRQQVILPVYGLAEASLAVAFPRLSSPFHYAELERKRLSIGDEVGPAAPEGDGVAFVSEGCAVPGMEISIRDENELPLGPNRVGLIYIKGDSVTQGYINNPEDTGELFSEDGWLNTNDIGVMLDGNLYVIGRRKEIIFLNGQNYYSSDLERLLQEQLGYETAVVGERTEEASRDQVYVFVISKGHSTDKEAISDRIRQVIRQAIGLEIRSIHFVPRFPRTTSGKVRRFKLLESIS